VIENCVDGIVFGISPSTREEHESIALVPKKVVTVRLSRGWLVGGEIKLSILKDIFVPAAREESTIEETVTRVAVEEVALHWIPDFIF